MSQSPATDGIIIISILFECNIHDTRFLCEPEGCKMGDCHKCISCGAESSAPHTEYKTMWHVEGCQMPAILRKFK